MSFESLQVIKALEGIFTPEGVDEWLTSPNAQLDGEEPIMFLEDQPEKLFALIDSLESGAVV